jgi:hypothetical protein
MGHVAACKAWEPVQDFKAASSNITKLVLTRAGHWYKVVKRICINIQSCDEFERKTLKSNKKIMIKSMYINVFFGL